MTNPKAKGQGPEHDAEGQAATAPPIKVGFANTIDKDIPIPPARGAAARYDFEKMKVGDSTFVERGENAVNISNVKAAAEKRVPGSKWTTRKVEEPVLDEHDQPTGDVRKGFRLWRTV